jgi:hypothetical protein
MKVVSYVSKLNQLLYQFSKVKSILWGLVAFFRKIFDNLLKKNIFVILWTKSNWPLIDRFTSLVTDVAPCKTVYLASRLVDQNCFQNQAEKILTV